MAMNTNAIQQISIHASAKEATSLLCFLVSILGFQSTPPRRRRQQSKKLHRSNENFNPRLREGGDSTTSLKSLAFPISIHASAKEATSIGANIVNGV